MGYLKILIVASIWLFLVLFIVLNKKMREDLILISNITIFKKIKVKDVVVVFSILVVFIYSGELVIEAAKNIF